jgi:hypothetical protein
MYVECEYTKTSEIQLHAYTSVGVESPANAALSL